MNNQLKVILFTGFTAASFSLLPLKASAAVMFYSVTANSGGTTLTDPQGNSLIFRLNDDQTLTFISNGFKYDEGEAKSTDLPDVNFPITQLPMGNIGDKNNYTNWAPVFPFFFGNVVVIGQAGTFQGVVTKISVPEPSLILGLMSLGLSSIVLKLKRKKYFYNSR